MTRIAIEHDPQIGIHNVGSDSSDYAGHVAVENAEGQRFPVPAEPIDKIAYRPQKTRIWYDYGRRRTLPTVRTHHAALQLLRKAPPR